MFLRRISDFFIKNRKKILSYIFLGAMFFMFLGGINISNISSYDQNNNSNLETLNLKISFEGYKVYAVDAGASDLSTSKGQKAYGGTSNSSSSDKDAQKWLDIWNGIVAGISAILGVLTYMVTMLLDPGFTSGTMFGINDKLHQIWILVSNVVYFIFAFLLIWIAFMNIIGKGDKWELKQAMPKFIVGVLIVPFSWFFVNLVVSLANILTFSALSLPADTFPSYKTVLSKINIPQSCELNLKTGAKQWLKCKPGDKNLGDITSGSAYGLLSTYTYGLLKIDTLPTVQGNNIASGAIKSVEDLIIYLLFSGIFILVYSILIITLAIVLLVRAVWLWIYLALSPLFGLAYFFGKDGGGDLTKKFNVSEFIGLAMVPFYSVLALSFGFLFLSITMQGLSTDAQKADKNSNYEITDKGMTITLPTKDGKVKTELKVDDSGAFANLLGDTKSAFNFAKEIGYTNGLGFIGAIFMNIFGVVVFRVAVMAALQASTITKAIVAPIKQFGDSVGSLVSKAPTYAPVFGGQSMQSMQNIASSAQTYYTSTKPSNAASKFMNDHHLFGNTGQIQTALSKLHGAVVKNDYKDMGVQANNLILKGGKLNEAVNNEKLIEGLLEVAKHLKIAGFKDKKVSDIKGNKELYIEMIRKIDADLQKNHSHDLLKDIDGTITNNFKTEDQYNQYIESLIHSGTTGTQTNNQTVTHNIKIEKGKDLDSSLLLNKDGETAVHQKDIDVEKTAKTIANILGETQEITEEEFKKELHAKIKELGINDDIFINNIITSIMKDKTFKFE